MCIRDSNTVDAYLTDLDKLLAYLTLENINILDVRLEKLEDFSAGLHDKMCIRDR